VPKLSIVIPADGSSDLLESGLVSVLQHRPADAEVLIVLTDAYADPYQLAGEVQFIEASPRASLVEAVNVGLKHCRSPFIHVLGCGTEVAEGWADAAMPHFADPRVAVVAPLVCDAARRRRIISAGLDYRAGGRRIERLAGRDVSRAAEAPIEVLGAPLTAAFFRRSSLEALGGSVETQVGDRLADIDLALQFHALGMKCILSPESIVLASSVRRRQHSFVTGLHSERFFLRNVPAGGWGKSLALHPGTVALDLLGGLPSPGAFLSLLGRSAAWFGFSRARKHQLRLAQLRALMATERPAPAIRLHAPHASTVDPRAAGNGRAARAQA
jgi:hypothetical protein